METKLNNCFKLGKNQSNLLKGIAIIIITIHNYTKYTPQIYGLGDNEFVFNSQTIWNHLDAMIHNPIWIFEIFSSLGFYFVQIFIFISGYGLTIQFLNKKQNIFQYLATQFCKLYALLIFGLIVYLLLNYELVSNLIGKKTFILEYLSLKGQLTSNIKVNASFLGPWWYFPLAFQLYLCFPIIFYFIKKFTYKGIACIALFYLIFSYFTIYSGFNFPLYASIIGHLPELTLGIILAQYRNIPFTRKLFFISLCIFTLSQFYKLFFPLSFLSATIIILYLARCVASKRISPRLIYVGKISMIIFLLNGMFRPFAYQYLLPIPILTSILYVICTIALSSIAFLIYTKTLGKVSTLLIQKYSLLFKPS